MDASTGLSIGSCHGLGRVKHINAVFLWVHDIVEQAKVVLGKKGTDGMLVDLLTKPLDRAQSVGNWPWRNIAAIEGIWI